jgi:hypothetical protein
MSQFELTTHNKVQRHSERGQYDKDLIYSIIDEALICHVGFVQDDQPFVIPTIHARIGDTIVLHGAVASRMLHHVADGYPLCVTCTLLDGLVFARSVFNHSMNYRSVVVFGRGQLIGDDEEKMEALTAIVEHVARGRWYDSRLPTRKELGATTVVKLPIESASAKIRTGPPKDDDEDYALPFWAGVLPLTQQPLAPIADPKLTDGIVTPEYVRQYHR